MKNISITRKDIEKAKKNNPTIIPASERPWNRPAVFRSKKAYSRKGKQNLESF